MARRCQIDGLHQSLDGCVDILDVAGSLKSPTKGNPQVIENRGCYAWMMWGDLESFLLQFNREIEILHISGSFKALFQALC